MQVPENETVLRMNGGKEEWFWVPIEGPLVGPFPSQEKAHKDGMENCWIKEED